MTMPDSGANEIIKKLAKQKLLAEITNEELEAELARRQKLAEEYEREMDAELARAERDMLHGRPSYKG